MPRTRRLTRKSNKRRNKRKPKMLTKSVKKALNTMLNKKLDAAIEDKYLLQTVYTDHSNSWSTSDRSCMFNVTPEVAKGTGVEQRTGDRLRIKFLRSFVRILPPNGHQQATVDGTPTYSKNWAPHLPVYKFRLMKMARKAFSLYSSADILDILNSKYPVKGECIQDVIQRSGRRGIKGITKLDEFIMVPKYRSINSAFQPINSSGAITGDPPSAFSLVATYSANHNVMWVPQYTYTNRVTNKVAQKIEMDDLDNLPTDYVYFYFVQCSNKQLDETYDPLQADAPQKLETRLVWVYEDA